MAWRQLPQRELSDPVLLDQGLSKFRTAPPIAGKATLLIAGGPLARRTSFVQSESADWARLSARRQPTSRRSASPRQMIEQVHRQRKDHGRRALAGDVVQRCEIAQLHRLGLLGEDPAGLD